DAWAVLAAIAAPLALLGTMDVLQRRSTLRRNYPILAHFRYGLESIGPEIRQYFIERDIERVPFSREQRALVYQRSKAVQDTVPFGSELDAYSVDYEWINHSIAPVHADDPDYRIVIGERCAQPYSASVFNISAMSFGSLSANAIRALNGGAKLGGFYHDTGEGSLSPYHREHGGDIVWEIGSGYFGCRDEGGRFDPERFRAVAHEPQVKMVELKLSQGAKPGHGGVLPAAKVTAEIALTRGVPMGIDCVSPARHTVFDTPIGLLEFVAKMRELSGGKPAGFKLAIGHPWEWFGIAKAMRETGLLPDFIVIDGAEGGTGAAPAEFIDHVGVPMAEGLLLVLNTLVGLGLRDKVKIGAAGRIISAFDIARTIALGADWCNAARGFMFALGCIQSQSCHTDKCPTGVATQNPGRWRKLDVPDKATRVFQYHRNTLLALRDLLGAAGLEHPQQLGPEHILRRVSPTEIRSLAMLHQYLEPGELLDRIPKHVVFQAFWADARSDSFAAPAKVGALRLAKAL
ncbi:MAG TPA: FMN-binding glutamate synthase family protein, partial [Xanthomonadaceae bacterium]|nr:FMN-binding glutamate synthase family protein [Xanthomonadaceae bacterium]